MRTLTERIDLVKKEIEADFKYCETLDSAIAFKGITYGYMFALANYSEVTTAESIELREFVDWWEKDMLPRWREKVSELSR